MKLAIIVPCYFEEAVLPLSIERLETVCGELASEGVEARLLFVDDGSRDATWELISGFAERYDNVGGLRLAHNGGHQNALWAGMEAVADQCDAVVTIDADLQDDEHAIVSMARLFMQEGRDVVYGVRRERRTDTFFKRSSAQAFYRLMNVAGCDLVYNHADFRLLSRRALLALLSYPERNLFLRGMVRTLGFSEAEVCYDRTSRAAGETKYPLRRMLSFAVDGITSFTTTPLTIITLAGFGFTLFSFAIIVYGLVRWACGHTLEGWTSLLVSIWFVGGVLLTAVGVIGTYVGKIYKEAKRRPRYIVQERV